MNIPIKKNFFYFIKRGEFTICDLEYSSKGKNTFDIKLFDIANNEKLLDIFNLVYLRGNFGKTYDYQSRAEWFCCYLSAFKTGEISDLQYEKSLTNPTVRILIEDESKLDIIKKLI